MSRSRLVSIIKLLVLVCLLAGAVILFRFTSLGDISWSQLRQTIEGLEPLSARLAYVGLYIVGTVLLVPGTLLSFVGAMLFGLWEGTLYTWIGATIGATLAYWVARLLGRDFVEGLLGGRLQALDRSLRDNGFTGLFIIRLVPLFPFNGVNFGCGLTGIRPRDYILATALGILPATFVYQFLFTRLREKILDEGFTWQDLLDPLLGLAIGLFVLLIVAGKWLARRLQSYNTPHG